MRARRRSRAWLVVGGCLLLAGCLSAEEEETVLSWLTCGECVDGQRDSVVSLAARKERSTVRYLGEALRDEDYVPHLRARLGIEFDAAADGSLDREAFVDAYASGYISAYRIRAAMALGDVGNGRAKKYLAAAAADQSLDAEVQAALAAALAAPPAVPVVIP